MRRRASAVIGRAGELGLLREALDAARSGHGGAVFLVGESGVGKSRLADAAAEMAFGAGMRIMRGRASSVGATVPLRPVTEAVLSLVRSYRLDEAALGPYRPILGRMVPDWAESPQLAPASPVILAEAVLRLADLAGRDGGCLLMLEDLQDSDAESLLVIEYLVDNLGHQPVLVLGTMLADESAALRVVTDAVRRERCRLMPVERLDASAAQDLVAACLSTPRDALPAAMLDLVWANSGGLPFLIEELLSGLIDGDALVASPDGWRLSEQALTRAPPGVARHLAADVDRLSPPGRTLLSLAALVGPRFPLTVVQEATGLSDRDLLNHLHNDVTAQFVAPDDQLADWYAFRHRLRREAVLAVLGPAERADLARTAAKAIQAVYSGLSGEWCHVYAELQLLAGNPTEAGLRYAEAGRRALAEGSVSSAVGLLDRAWQLIDEDDSAARASTLELMLWALAEAGQVDRALASLDPLDRMGGLDRRRRVELHTRLAWAAAVAGRPTDAQAQVAAARRLLGPDGDDAAAAQIDVVEAHVALDVAGRDAMSRAEELARRAAAVADATPLPVVSCQAWQLLGSLMRHRDPDEATRCLERARSIAVRHRLPIWEIHALIRLGNDDALRGGGLDRLELAHRRASEVGAVTARYQAESSMAFHTILRGDYEQAAALIASVLPDARRLRLVETQVYALLLQATLAGHRGRRAEMEAALVEARAEISRAGGNETIYRPRIYGLARTFCALLEEDRDLARHELATALAAEADTPTVFPLTGRFGLDLLLRAASGELPGDELGRSSAAPASGMRWERQFAGFAAAILHGRAGRPSAAAAAVDEAVRLGQPYPTARFLGLRLVCESMLEDGWGSPVPWLRQATEYFDRVQVPAVALACRQLLRRAGARLGQRRPGVNKITESMRSVGVTAREFEVLRLLAGRLSNREIAQRLHLSPRTVERHISSLLQKTGRASRIELSELAVGETADREDAP